MGHDSLDLDHNQHWVTCMCLLAWDSFHPLPFTIGALLWVSVPFLDLVVPYEVVIYALATHFNGVILLFGQFIIGKDIHFIQTTQD